MKQIVRFCCMFAGLIQFMAQPAAAPGNRPGLEVRADNGWIIDFFDYELDGYPDRVLVIKPNAGVDQYTPNNTSAADWRRIQELYWRTAFRANQANRQIALGRK